MIRYVDKLGFGDSAIFRITPLPSDAKVAEPGALDQPEESDGDVGKSQELKQQKDGR